MFFHWRSAMTVIMMTLTGVQLCPPRHHAASIERMQVKSHWFGVHLVSRLARLDRVSGPTLAKALHACFVLSLALTGSARPM